MLVNCGCKGVDDPRHYPEANDRHCGDQAHRRKANAHGGHLVLWQRSLCCGNLPGSTLRAEFSLEQYLLAAIHAELHLRFCGWQQVGSGYFESFCAAVHAILTFGGDFFSAADTVHKTLPPYFFHPLELFSRNIIGRLSDRFVEPAKPSLYINNACSDFDG